ncbi:hypothetical protein Ahy_B08g091298 [Arachis hypogaea]|uniref:Ubiquitin-like protease family profile domain-containing protein n=1 Tax=Arachis hypogaea TaxID=3818 RepID=A0A444Y1V9_ARAHY|nr:hypothetical protein Ahy_B08g091298 [Arachis hypogaea]
MLQNMVIGNHEGGEFLQPKTKKPFNIEDYKMFIPFLDLKKLASHPYIFALVCYVEHWWLWMTDVRKKNFCILDPYHKTCPSKPRMKLNKFIGYVISRMREALLKKDDREIEPPYINIAGQKTHYDCTIYVMKWLEIIESQNIKRGRYNWENWTQADVDYFRVEYASHILFHEMNQDKDRAIKESEAIRLSKPSAVLLSPYCQIDTYDIDSD